MMRKFLTYILVLMSVVACSKGPGGDELNTQIQTKLDTDFGSGIFQITKLSRRGSYSYTELGESTKKLMVYYKATLEFKKDYALTDWDSLSVGSLSYILGATPSGIAGVLPQGNKAGDKLLVFGTANYKDVEGQWVSIAPKFKELKGKSGGQKKYVAEIDESEAGSNVPEYKKSLKILGNIFGKLNKESDRKDIQVAEFELQQVMQKARMATAMRDGVLSIATGSPLGNYYAIGKGLEDFHNSNDKVKAFSTSGSVENCHLVNEKKVSFSIVQSDMASMAYKGEEIFRDSIPMKDMRAVAALYPEALMVVTRKKDNIKKFGELSGKRISIGVKGSGHRADAIQLIKAHKMTRSDFAEIRENSFRAAVAELKNEAVDAIFVTGAYPMNALNDLNEEVPLHVVSLSGNIIKHLTEKYPVIPMVLPVNTYRGQTKVIKTVGVTALIVTHKDTPNDAVKVIMSTLVNKSGDLAKRSVQANYITRRTMRRGVPIPLHKGASEFYKNK